jgi:uncharacterized membrane protein
MIHLKWSALREGRWYEYIARFALGGVATCFAGLVANAYGPAVGGLFLAFPVVFSAGATMIETHERRRKREKQMRGERRGREAAALDAAGAGWGSIGLAVFAAIVWIGPIGVSFGITLAAASIAWVLVAILMWLLRKAL